MDAEVYLVMKVGSWLLNMVKELRDNGWRTFEQQFDTGNAYNEMLKTKK
jgi:hypothetical protein